MLVYRACNAFGLVLEAEGRRVVFNDDAPALISSSPFAPDLFGDEACFASREDRAEDPDAFGMWVMRRGETDARRFANWRSWFTGRYAPDGAYIFSGKPGDSTIYPSSGRGAWWSYKLGVLRGPFESGTTNIEGIADFVLTGDEYHPVWQDRGSPRRFGTRTLALWARSGRWVLGVEKGHDRVIASVDDGATWLLVTTTKVQVFPSICQQQDGSLLVAWNAGSAHRLLRSSTWPELPPDAATPPAPPSTGEPTIGKFPRPIFFASYDVYAEPAYGVSARPIGNMAFPWLESVGAVDRTMPLIAGFDTYVPARDDQTFYYYIHAHGSAPWETAAPQWDVIRRWPEKPVILYVDRREWPEDLPEWLPRRRAFLAAQAYPNKDESPAQFATSMRLAFDRLARFGLPMVLTPCFYNRNHALTIAQVRAVMPVYAELVRRYKVVGIMPFSDRRAGQGMAAHPELYDDAQALFDAIPARPNRYTYWTPSDVALRRRALKDQVRYEISGFSTEQADRLCALIDAHG